MISKFRRKTVKRFSTRKLMSAMVISLLVVSLIGCKTTKATVEEAPAAKPFVTQPEKKAEQPAQKTPAEVTPVATKVTPVEKVVEKEAPVVEEKAVVEYPFGIEPVVKSDENYPIFDLFIVHTNDVNGSVTATANNIGYSRLSTMLKVARSLTNNILVLDAGNTTSGSPIVDKTNGETAGVLLDMLGYDAIAPAEGEYAYGAPYLMNVAASSKDYTDLRVLAANVLDEDEYLPFQPYQLYDYNGFTVLVVGLTAPVDCNSDLSFMSDSVINNAQYALDVANQYADYIVVLGNMNNSITSEMICKNLNGIDLFVDGTSSTMSGKVVNGTTIVSAQPEMGSVGVVDVVVKNNMVTGTYPLEITACDVDNPKDSALASAYGIVNIPEDPQVASYIANQTAKVNAMMPKKSVTVKIKTKVTTSTTTTTKPAMEAEEPVAKYPLGIEPIVKSDADYPVFDLFVVHTNDVQGKVYGSANNVGYARLSTMLQVARSLTDNILVLDAGDAGVGSPLVELTNGEVPALLLDMLGYDAIAPSTGEFLYKDLAEISKFANQNSSLKVLSANMLDEDGYLPFQPYQLYDFNGFTVLVVGLSAPESVDPSNDYSYMSDAVVMNAQYALDMAKQYADYIIVLGNMNDGRNGITSKTISESLNGIDLFVDGTNSHMASGEVVNGTTIVNAGEDMYNVGVVDIVVKNGMAISTNPVTISASDVEDPANSALASAFGIVNIPEDSKVVKFLAAEEAKIAPQLQKVIANVPYTLSVKNIKKQPTSLSKFVSSAMTSEYGVDATIINAGMFAQEIEKGDVTLGDVRNSMAYPYTTTIQKMTGAEIYEALEIGYSVLPEESDDYILTDLKVIYNKYAEAGKRILRVKMGNEYIDKDATYTIATNEYLSHGMGGYSMGTRIGEGNSFFNTLVKALSAKYSK
jgi:2',3'-cyclic-nucleotide 2'-phosphodiesterase (5'-nucleotidase family)